MLKFGIKSRRHYAVICKCRCGERFMAYAKCPQGGGSLYIPEYKRGHHPNCRKNQTGSLPAWNAGKKKGDHPALARMGFQFGRGHWNWRDDQNPNWFARDFDHVALARAFGKKRRTRFVSKLWGKFRDAILERDGYQCVRCGYPWGTPMDDPTMLHVHHIQEVEIAPDRIFDDENVETLCRPCHWAEHRGHGRRKRLLSQ